MATRVRDGLRERKLSQRDAGHLAGLDPKTFSNLGRPDGPSPTLEGIEGAARVLHCEPWELLRSETSAAPSVATVGALVVHDLEGSYAVEGKQDELLTLLLAEWAYLGPEERWKLVSRARRLSSRSPPAAGNGPGPALRARRTRP